MDESPESFEECVSETLDELPAEVSRVMDKHGIDVVIKDHPDRSIREEFGSQLFGLFTGRPLSEQEAPGTTLEPTRIELYEYVFQDNISDPVRRKKQIKKTVLHEVGHFLGMDEEQLREKGF